MEASILFPEMMSFDSNSKIRIATPKISRSKRRRQIKKQRFRLMKEGKEAPPIKPPSFSSCSGVSPLTDVLSPDLLKKEGKPPSSSSCSSVSPPSGMVSPDLFKKVGKPPSSSSCSSVSPSSGVVSPDFEPRSVSEGLIYNLMISMRVDEDSFTGKKRQPPSSDLGSSYQYNLRLRPRE